MSAPVPFYFAPVPREAFAALRQGTLVEHEFVVLAAIVNGASSQTWTAVFRDLEHLAGVVAWSKSLDYLSKTLRSLRDKGWITYTSRPGAVRHRYELRLLVEELGQSEQGPSSQQGKSQGSEAGKLGPGPSTASSGPSTTAHEIPAKRARSQPETAAPVRASRDVSRETPHGGERVHVEVQEDVARAREEAAQSTEELLASTARMISMTRSAALPARERAVLDELVSLLDAREVDAKAAA